ncbi:MAG: PEP-CTERM sorting domain-containing protein [Armatimonadota bacterium]|nr:PEP-CTERM sorting domain-containing protein [Armatimonadota bacterium]
MKNLIALLVVMSRLLAAAVPAIATTVDLNDGWYAQVRNVLIYDELAYDDRGHLGAWTTGGWTDKADASQIHIDMQTPGVYRFNMSSGSVTVGQQDARLFNQYLPITARYGGIQFDWESDWPESPAANYLRLEVWGHRWDEASNVYSYDLLYYTPYGSDTVAGSMIARFGQAYNGYDLHLTVGPIPEPSSILALAGGIAGLGCLRLRRRRR